MPGCMDWPPFRLVVLRVTLTTETHPPCDCGSKYCFLRFPDVDRSRDRLRDFVKQEVLGEQSGHVKQARQCTLNVPAAPA